MEANIGLNEEEYNLIIFQKSKALDLVLENLITESECLDLYILFLFWEKEVSGNKKVKLFQGLTIVL